MPCFSVQANIKPFQAWARLPGPLFQEDEFEWELSKQEERLGSTTVPDLHAVEVIGRGFREMHMVAKFYKPNQKIQQVFYIKPLPLKPHAKNPSIMLSNLLLTYAQL